MENRNINSEFKSKLFYGTAFRTQRRIWRKVSTFQGWGLPHFGSSRITARLSFLPEDMTSLWTLSLAGGKTLCDALTLGRGCQPSTARVMRSQLTDRGSRKGTC